MPSTWPIEPGESPLVPTLDEVVAEDPALEPFVQLVRDAAKPLETGGARSVMFQQVVETPLGKVTLPCLAELPDELVAVYSHHGPWTRPDIDRLIDWAARVRSRYFEQVRIILATDADEPIELIERAHEVVYRGPASMFALLAGRRFGGDPTENAEVLAGACEAIFGTAPTVDRGGLALLDGFLADTIGPVAPAFVFFDRLVGLLGAFLGEVIVRAHGGKWSEPSPRKPAWMRTVELSAKLDPFVRVAEVIAGGRGGLVTCFDAIGDEPHPTGQKTEPREIDVTDDGARRIYGVLAHLAACDGHVDPREREMLQAYRDRLGLDPAEAHQIEIDAADGKVRVGKEPGERRILQTAMLDIIMADGVVHEQERLRVVRIVKALGLQSADLIGPLRFMLVETDGD